MLVSYWWSKIKIIFITRKKRILNKISPFRATAHVHFVILCMPRTGSTLLHTLLNSHPNIISYGEVLRRNYVRGKQTDLSADIFKKHQTSIKAIGLKLFYEYRTKQDFKDYYREITRNKNVKIIHLVRENLLDSFISLKNAQ